MLKLNQKLFVLYSCCAQVQLKQLFITLMLGSGEWHSGESARLPPLWPGFNHSRTWCHMCVNCCWFLSLLRGSSSGSSGFPLTPKSHIPIRSGNRGKEEPPSRMSILKFLNIISIFISITIIN